MLLKQRSYCIFGVFLAGVAFFSNAENVEPAQIIKASPWVNDGPAECTDAIWKPDVSSLSAANVYRQERECSQNMRRLVAVRENGSLLKKVQRKKERVIESRMEPGGLDSTVSVLKSKEFTPWKVLKTQSCTSPVGDAFWYDQGKMGNQIMMCNALMERIRPTVYLKESGRKILAPELTERETKNAQAVVVIPVLGSRETWRELKTLEPYIAKVDYSCAPSSAERGWPMNEIRWSFRNCEKTSQIRLDKIEISNSGDERRVALRTTEQKESFTIFTPEIGDDDYQVSSEIVSKTGDVLSIDGACWNDVLPADEVPVDLIFEQYAECLVEREVQDVDVRRFASGKVYEVPRERRTEQVRAIVSRPAFGEKDTMIAQGISSWGNWHLDGMEHCGEWLGTSLQFPIKTLGTSVRSCSYSYMRQKTRVDMMQSGIREWVLDTEMKTEVRYQTLLLSGVMLWHSPIGSLSSANKVIPNPYTSNYPDFADYVKVTASSTQSNVKVSVQLQSGVEVFQWDKPGTKVFFLSLKGEPIPRWEIVGDVPDGVVIKIDLEQKP